MRAVFLVSIAIFFVFSIRSQAQTSGFVYQGKLQDGGIAANGTYQFEFKLYDGISGGSQIGQTITNLTATVTNGIFAVNLDFGANSFSGAARFLEIGVRLNGSGQPYTLLTPRQSVTSTPYAVRSLNANQANIAIDAANLGGIPAAQYVITTDPRMSDDRNPLPNSPNYIQNSQNQQASSNFNISGTGRSNIFDAAAQFNLNGGRILSASGNENIFAGFNSGPVNTGGFNAFFGTQTGKVNTTGSSNSFFGSYAGSSNTIGNSNSFFGINSGASNLDGGSNAFFGGASGFSNTSGANNSYFGVSAGQGNQIAANNAMFGFSAGKVNTGGGNSFVGAFSGEKNTTGTFNSYFGLRSGKDAFSGNYNVYIGYETGAGNQAGSNNTFLGSSTSGLGNNNTLAGFSINGGNGNNNSAFGYNTSINNGISNATAIGADAVADESNAIVLGSSNAKVKIPGIGLWSFGSITTPSTVNAGILKSSSLTVTGGASVSGGLNVGTVFASGDVNAAAGDFSGNLTGQYVGLRALVSGSEAVCLQAPNPNFPERFLGQCSSSRRYKDNIQDFKGGIEMVKRLRPVTFNWKQGGAQDIGFVAEEVNEVEPLLNVYNQRGEIEGVKYAQVTTVLVNAVKEQQLQIERLDDTIRKLSEQIELLKALVCSQNNSTPVCGQKGVENEKEN
ncbi:MAG: tail fiber domain-containing protein [Acidobacteria bacterium]|nr:tail fiber domain-containing protein [Acidobacteriota bacterium]